MKIETFLLPEIRYREIDFANSAALMIDALRAGTTICAALSNGAKEVIPCESIEQAVIMKNSLLEGASFLGGERKGLKPDGFDAGNSPLEYSRDAVFGKSVILTTTNGTKIFGKCGEAKEAIIGAYVNIDAALQFIDGIFDELQEKKLLIFCAGTDGEFSYEDAVCAGAFIDSAERRENCILDDSSLAARNLYLKHKNDIEMLNLPGRHIEYLKSIGFEKDIHYALKVGAVPVVPIFRGGAFVLV